jgi:predicted transcriptional regulator
MSTPTIPISEASRQLLCELAEQTGQSMTDILDKALGAYRRQLFFEQLNAGYAALRADPQAWAEELQERKLWDATLMDGLDPNEHWTNDGRCLTPEQEEQ